MTAFYKFIGSTLYFTRENYSLMTNHYKRYIFERVILVIDEEQVHITSESHQSFNNLTAEIIFCNPA